MEERNRRRWKVKNIKLETCILKCLANVDTGLREKTLMNEVSIDMDRPTLTTDEFLDALHAVEDRALVDRWTNLMGETVWGITDLGKNALKGL